MRVMTAVPSAVLLIAAAALVPTAAAAQTATDVFAGVRPVEVLLLGTFHFDDPGLDDYKPQFPWNALDPAHQREIEEVVQLLAAFRPTRIALEWSAARQPALDSAYRTFLSGAESPSPDEREQLGFRLARQLGHERVFAIDAPARSYDPAMTQEEYDQRVAGLMVGADPDLLARQQDLEARYQRLAQHDDSLKTVVTLRESLLHENDPERVLESHGQYLIGGFYLGRDDDYLGPDMRTRWYNRNLRIVHNLQRITRGRDERILVIIGAGHLPILAHALRASPEYRVVEVRDYMGRE